MASNMECFHAILEGLVDLVVVNEYELGFKVGVALCKIAGGSLRRMAGVVTPLLIDRFLFYCHPQRRQAQRLMSGMSSWRTVEIKNYAIVINDIFEQVP